MIQLLTRRVLAAAFVMTAMMARADDAVTTAELDAAISRGVSFLTKSQNANGSWGGPTMTKGLTVYAPLPGAHHAFRAGTSSLALCGLIDSRDARPETRAAIEKAAAWMAAEMPKLRRADTTTTYNVWGHAYGLHAFQRLHSIEMDPQHKAEWARLAQQQIDLANRYEDVFGGWSYLDIFDELATRRPSGIPTSFTTATMLLAMASARDSMGLTLDEKTIKSALAGLRRQRMRQPPRVMYSVANPSHRLPPAQWRSTRSCAAYSAPPRGYGW